MTDQATPPEDTEGEPTDEELLAAINPLGFKGSPEYRRKMHSMTKQISEITQWLLDNTGGQVQLSGNPMSRLETFIDFGVQKGWWSNDDIEEFQLAFQEGFLRDAKDLRGKVQKHINQQHLLAGVPGVDPSAGMTPGARLLRG